MCGTAEGAGKCKATCKTGFGVKSATAQCDGKHTFLSSHFSSINLNVFLMLFNFTFEITILRMLCVHNTNTLVFAKFSAIHTITLLQSRPILNVNKCHVELF